MSKVACSPGFSGSPRSEPRTPMGGRTPKHHPKHPTPGPRAEAPGFPGGWGREEAGPAGPLVGAKSAREIEGANAAWSPCCCGGGRLALLRGWETQRLRRLPPPTPPPTPGDGGTRGRQARSRRPVPSEARWARSPPSPGSRWPPAGRSQERRGQALKSRAPRPRLSPALTPAPPGRRALRALARPQRPGHGRPGPGWAPQRSRSARREGAGADAPRRRRGAARAQAAQCRRPSARARRGASRPQPQAERPRLGRPGARDWRGAGAEERRSPTLISISAVWEAGTGRPGGMSLIGEEGRSQGGTRSRLSGKDKVWGGRPREGQRPRPHLRPPNGHCLAISRPRRRPRRG